MIIHRGFLFIWLKIDVLVIPFEEEKVNIKLKFKHFESNRLV